MSDSTGETFLPAVIAAGAPARAKPSSYPAPFAARMAGRVKRPLGDLFGLRNFGVNLTSRWYKCFGCSASGRLSLLPERVFLTQRGDIGAELFPDIGEWTGDTSSAFPVDRKLDTTVWMETHFTPLGGAGGGLVCEKAREYLRSRGVGQGYEVGLLDTEPTRIVFPFFMGEEVVYLFELREP